MPHQAKTTPRQGPAALTGAALRSSAGRGRDVAAQCTRTASQGVGARCGPICAGAHFVGESARRVGWWREAQEGGYCSPPTEVKHRGASCIGERTTAACPLSAARHTRAVARRARWAGVSTRERTVAQEESREDTRRATRSRRGCVLATGSPGHRGRRREGFSGESGVRCDRSDQQGKAPQQVSNPPGGPGVAGSEQPAYATNASPLIAKPNAAATSERVPLGNRTRAEGLALDARLSNC